MAADGSAGAGSRTRYGIIAAGIGLIALLAGVAVAGLPTEVPDDIELADIQPPPSTTTTTIPATTDPVEATAAGSTSATSRSSSEATTKPLRPAASAPASNEPRPQSTASSSPTDPPPAPTTTLLDVAATRVVVANAGGADLLAASHASTVRGFGYTQVEAANASARRGRSVVYWSPLREGEARRLADQLGIGTVEPQPGGQIVLGNYDADVWVLVGGDRS